MRRRTVILAALVLGFGCSHAPPKPNPSAVASVPRTAPPPVVTDRPAEVSQAPPANRDDPGENAIYFDFDSAMLREDARPTLQRIGKALANNNKSIRIEGNCDERGTTEYNIVLGEQRAREAKRYLEHLGVAGRRISVVSFGSERPKYQGHDETAHAKNRRDDFVVR